LFLLTTNTEALTKFYNILLLFLLSFVMAFSCHQKEASASTVEVGEESEPPQNYTTKKMSVNEFISWCANENNKLSKVKTIADMAYKLSYLPTEAMAYLELRTEEYTAEKFQKTCKSYNQMTYFKFRIEALGGNGELLKYNLQSPQQYDYRVKYTSFDMQNDVYLVQGKDTLKPGLFQFERIFEAAPYGTAMFAFDNTLFNKNNEFTVVYNDKLFDKGFIKFNYKNKQLINLPNIIL
jgi:hypothetical protein